MTSSPDARLDRMDVILPASSAWREGRGRAGSATDRATAGEMRTRTASEAMAAARGVAPPAAARFNEPAVAARQRCHARESL